MSLVIRRAHHEEFSTLLKFYRENGYNPEVDPADAFYIAEDEDELIGVVRLAREFGLTVLRGMRISPARQRMGIGTLLLHLLEKDLARTDCYCLPYLHLVGFYGQIGFRVLDPAGAPPHLIERIAGYRALHNGKQYTLMYRPANSHVPPAA